MTMFARPHSACRELNMFAGPHSACREFFMNDIFDNFWALMAIYVERKDFEKDFVRF